MFRSLFGTPTARKAFGGLSDEKWLKVINRSQTQPVIKGVRLPGFAPPEMQSHTVGSSGRQTLAEACRFYSYVKKVCAEHGAPIRPGSHILDFGVSWGRIIRFFLKDVDPETLHGVDISADYLNAARETGVPGHLHQIDPLGRIPYDDQSFDVVYAYSVFTHLPEHVQDHWLTDIQRVLKPGGLLIATVEPPRFLDHFNEVDASNPSLHPWHAMMARKIQADATIQSRLQARGFVYIPFANEEGEVYGDCVMTPDYARQHWGRHFEILEWLDDKSRFWQAVVVARKR